MRSDNTSRSLTMVLVPATVQVGARTNLLRITDRRWAVMDDVNLQDLFQEKFSTLQSCPQSFRGRYRHACRQVLEVRHGRGKRSVCCPSFSSDAPSVRFVRERGCGRFRWTKLWLPVPVKPRSEAPLSSEHRGEKAAQKVWLGEITCARQCLTGAPLAPGNDNTFNELQRKRPQEVVRELPEHVRAFTPETPLVVNKEILLKSLKSSPRGSSPGPGGCTYEHLKVRHVQPVARGSDQPRSSEGASQHLQGVDGGFEQVRFYPL